MPDTITSWLLGGSLGSVLTFTYNYWENKKKVHFFNITNQRIKWAEEIKKNITEFISGIQCYRIELGDDRRKLEKDLISKMELIQLNLNPLKDDFDENYINEMRVLFRATISLNLTEDMLVRFRELSQRMVKIEWDGIKLEAEKGNPSKYDKLKLRRKWLQY